MDRKSPILGMAAAAALFAAYYAILSLVNSPKHAAEELARFWYWIAILALGFGVQVALYSHVRRKMKEKMRAATAEVATAGGISAGSMIACCAHHVATDFLPFMGVSAAAVFLAKYQTPLYVTGVFSNVIGASLMLNAIQKHGLYPERGILAALKKVDAAKLRNVAIATGVFFVSLSFALSGDLGGLDKSVAGGSDAAGERGPTASAGVESEAAQSDNSGGDVGKTKTNDENAVEMAVTLENSGREAPLAFEVSINTHSVALDFDLTKASYAEDDEGTVYRPVKWVGTPPGGHHRSGSLYFPKIKSGAKSIKLVVENIAGVPRRVFEWKLGK